MNADYDPQLRNLSNAEIADLIRTNGNLDLITSELIRRIDPATASNYRDNNFQSVKTKYMGENSEI